MAKSEILNVNLEDRSYDIVMGEDMLAKAGPYFKKILPSPFVIIVTDKVVSAIHLERFTQSLVLENIEYQTLVMPSGEGTKSFECLIDLLDRIFSMNPERSSTLVAFGGGVVGDLTGFAASILLRGINFIQVPTTLLAQVDSSVGGKTGINNRFGKNLIGSFYQPRLVITDISLLNTLPKRQFLSGYAEVVKYGLINDKEFFGWLDSHIKELKNKDPEALLYAVHKSCVAKANIVSADEKEQGKRALLNLGHTFAHALESDTGYSDLLLHGEAVSIGMVMAFKLSCAMGYCDLKEVEKVVSHLDAMGLPTCLDHVKHNWQISNLVSSMSHDKKVQNGKLVFILVKGIGQAFIKKDVDPDAVYATLKSLD